MKLYTEEEVIQKGRDPSVAAAYGNIDLLRIFAAQFHDEIRLDYPISVDERVHSLQARMNVPFTLKSMTFKVEELPDRRIKPRFLDVMGLSPLTGDSLENAGCLRGIRTLVSESAREKLEPFLKDECTFVPTKVDGAPQPYYILWVHKICDVLNEERTLLKPISYTPHKKRCFRADYHLDKIDATYLFRLPQWKYEMDCDLALKPFRDLVRKLKIKGFQFAIGGLDGPHLKE